MRISQYLDLPKKMYDARTKSGMSQKYIADKMGITKQSYSRYENGIAEPSIESLEIFCKEVHVTIPELLGINDPTTGYTPITHFSQWLYMLKELEDHGIDIDYDVENVTPGSMTGIYKIDQTQIGTIALVLKDLHHKLESSKITHGEYDTKINELISIYNVPISEYVDVQKQNTNKSLIDAIKTKLFETNE